MRPLEPFFLSLALCQPTFLFSQEQPEPFILGAQTHFKQGWPLRLLEPAEMLEVVALRDEIRWSTVEVTKGVYDFSVADLYMLPLIEKGFKPLIVINEVNPLYDEANTPFTQEGRAAFAAFVSAILTHYGVGSVKIEIGNEINTTDFVHGPALDNPAGHFAALSRAVDQRLAVDHPQARFSCSGLNTIGISFYRDFFRRGGLLACDAISVHPYRQYPETLLGEFDRLKLLMREFGGEKPIQVTEFGAWFTDAQDAPDYMLKMVILMYSANVNEAYWYALTDEEFWPNMGLLDMSGSDRKPAAAAFSFLNESVLPLGVPVRQGDDSANFIYQLGPNGKAAVFWGSGGNINIEGDVKYFNSEGEQIAPVDTVSDSPIIVLGESVSIALAEPNRIADSVNQYGKPPWSYFARRPDIGLVPLEIIDSNWTSTRSAPDLSPLQISDRGITVARFNGEPYSAVERYTAIKSGVHAIKGWWKASENSDGPSLLILHNERPVLEADISHETFALSEKSISLEVGDTLDFEVLPNPPDGAGSLQRRIRIIGP